MIKGGGVDDHEARQVVLVWRKVAVPRHHIEYRVFLPVSENVAAATRITHLLGLEQRALELVDDGKVARALLKSRCREQEVTWRRKSVCACRQDEKPPGQMQHTTHRWDPGWAGGTTSRKSRICSHCLQVSSDMGMIETAQYVPGRALNLNGIADAALHME